MVQTIGEASVLPVIEQMFEQVPFEIRTMTALERLASLSDAYQFLREAFRSNTCARARPRVRQGVNTRRTQQGTAPIGANRLAASATPVIRTSTAPPSAAPE